MKKKTRKRLFAYVLIFMLLGSLSAVFAYYTDDAEPQPSEPIAAHMGGICLTCGENPCMAIDTGEFPISWVCFTPGATWRLYEDGTVFVDGGFIERVGFSNPWFIPVGSVSKFIFTEPITAGASLSGLFMGLSNVTEMEGLSHFDTSSVQDMSSMFSGVDRLTSLDLSGWDTGSVTDMSGMFADASGLISLDLSGWDTSNVWDMSWMFSGANSLRQLTLGENFLFVGDAGLPDVPINEYYTGEWVNTDGTLTFTSAELMQNPVALADTWVWQRQDVGSPLLCLTCGEDSCIATHFGAFEDGPQGQAGAPWRLYIGGALDGTLFVDSGFINWTGVSSPWFIHRNRVSRIAFTGPIIAGANLNDLFSQLSNVTTIEGLSYFDTSNVTNMSWMFRGASGLTSLDLSGWDTGNVTTMSSMFDGASRLTSLDLSGWDTGNVTNMGGMFAHASGLTHLDLSGWNTGNVTSMGSMFSRASGLTSLDLSNWDTRNVMWMNNMFDGASGLTSLDLSGWDTSSATEMGGMFTSTNGLTSLDLSMWDTSSVRDMDSMFSSSGLTSLNVSSWNTSRVTNMRHIFSWTSDLTSLDLSDWDTSSVTNMSWMFFRASGLTSLDLSGWDTGSVTDMGDMFRYASGLTSLDLSGWDTGSVTNMRSMFDGASRLTSLLGVSSWDTSSVRYMNGMFWDASGLTSLDLSIWDTSSVRWMNHMFINAIGLTSLDLSSWDTSNVTNMNHMFSGATSLRQLTLGENFQFRDNAALPSVPTHDDYTGRWQNVGTGTADDPLGTYVLTSAELMENLGATALPDTWVWQRVVPTEIVRFHFDGGYEQFALVLGQSINHQFTELQLTVPVPATRYGTQGSPGQAFMGWFTMESFPYMHYIHNPSRAVAFDLDSIIFEHMLDDRVLNLHGSWLRYGNVLGRGNENTMPNMIDHGTLHARALGMITDADLIMATADVNVDYMVNMADHGILHQFLLGFPVILGVPAP